jgi:inosine/xanthosine triphosphate pyrophosphatase family protein
MFQMMVSLIKYFLVLYQNVHILLNEYLLKYNIINIDLDVPEIQTISVEEVTKEKINSAYELLKKNFNEIIEKFNEKGVKINNVNDVIVISEDTGLYINDMKKFPGALIKFYLGSIGINGIIDMNGNSKAKAQTVIGIIKYGKIMKPIVGNRTGKIATDSPEFEIAENNVKSQIDKFLSNNGTKSVDFFHKKLGLIMWNKVGMGRNAEGLQEAMLSSLCLISGVLRVVREPRLPPRVADCLHADVVLHVEIH